MGIFDQEQDEPASVCADPAHLRVEARLAALEAAVARLEGGPVADAPAGAPPWGTPPSAAPAAKPAPARPVRRQGRLTQITGYHTSRASTAEEVAQVCQQVAGTVWAADSPPVRLSGIGWRVLGVDGARALLLADRVIGTSPYHREQGAITWESCDLRRWLNEEFCGSLGEPVVSRVAVVRKKNGPNPAWGTPGCFGTKDRVFLLSAEEAAVWFKGREPKNWGKHLRNMRLGKSAQAANETGTRSVWWWLRSPGYEPDCAAYVDDNGDLNVGGRGVSAADGGVRPAFLLDLAS